jgi:hypothetical protein
MESGEVHGGFLVRDLRVDNEDFCKIWGCRSFKIGYSCHWCPVITDLQRMARALNVKLQVPESIKGQILTPVLAEEFSHNGNGV